MTKNLRYQPYVQDKYISLLSLRPGSRQPYAKDFSPRKNWSGSQRAESPEPKIPNFWHRAGIQDLSDLMMMTSSFLTFLLDRKS